MPNRKANTPRVSLHGYLFLGAKAVHRMTWEQANGPIPKGYVVHHKDHNKLNNSIDNLECIPRGSHQTLHNTGRVFTEERKANISAATMGRPCSEAAKEATRKLHKGKPLSEETRKKISISHTGVPHSEERKAAISAAKKGSK
jgi:hypothetical protein